MNTIIERYQKIKSNILDLNSPKSVNIVAISKTFPMSHVKPLLDFGHIHFGENKVQEAKHKWTEVRKINTNFKLHMVGRLQSNKAKDAIKTFDYIHSLDSQKLADILSKHQIETNKFLKYFIQVNIGNELQKSGIPPTELESFFNYCRNEKKLNIQGLMIIPPNDNNPTKYFDSINKLNSSLGLKELSMGMSSDYKEAIINNSTFIRVGSLIFGNRS